jgi:catechol 2,3-dioxygenase-like lactoylglutathione lyase family enzyme
LEEFYPMPMFVVLEVSDLAASATWYERALGFRVVYSGPPGTMALVHLRRKRCQDLLLVPPAGGAVDRPGQGVLVQFEASPVPVSQIADRARSVQSTVVEEPVERPWNVRDVTVVDPDGYRLRFSEPVRTDLSFEEVMGQVAPGE